ncbi:MAG: hypothetical protein JWN22_3545 [Nocardioides sp.]|nr:hypothetical protein [Nocardioides sp.]
MSPTQETRLAQVLRQIADEAPPFRSHGVNYPTRSDRRKVHIVIGSAAAVVIIAGTGYAAGTYWSPGPKPASPAHSPLSAPDGTSTSSSQRPELRSRDEVRDAAAPLASLYRAPGFGSVALDFGTRTVTVWWKGPAPSQVMEAVGTDDNGVTVELRSAAYSDAELSDAAQRVADSGPQFGVEVNYVTKTDDLSGIVVYIGEQDAKGRDLDALSESLESVANVSVHVRVGEKVAFQ